MRPAGAITALALLAAGGAGSAPAQVPGVTLLDTAVIRAPLLHESSGVAASRRRGVYWSINDSGNRPLLLATDSTGRDLGFVRVRGARAVDWEELTAGPCPSSPARCLYIGDIGDNNERRRQIVVYIVAEPEPSTQAADTIRAVDVADSLVLRYPDHPHDAEAMAIGPDRTLFIITKDRSDAPMMFGAPIDSTRSPIVLRRFGELPITVSLTRGRLVTGAAMSPNGRWLAVRTYISLHFFRFGPSLQPLTSRSGITIPVVESQGEAVTFDGNDRLVLTSERGSNDHAILTRLRLTNLTP